MATKFFFDNKVVKIPGAYSTIVSGEQSQPIQLDYGKVLVIDTGVKNQEYGGGSGVNGEQSKGKDSIYTFNNLSDYQRFLKGGYFWKIAEALFKPDKKIGATGVSTILHVKASTTTKAQLTFETDHVANVNGGLFKINTVDEGLCANGEASPSSFLHKGYAYNIRTGENDNTKWIMDFYLGSYVGEYTDGLSYNEILKEESKPILLVSSPEFNNINELIEWGQTSSKFGRYFSVDSSSNAIGTGEVLQTDIDDIDLLQLAVGGTETFSLEDFNKILDAVSDEDFSFIITDQYGISNYSSSYNTSILSFINGDSKFKHFLYVGGGQNEDEFDTVTGSLNIAKYFNSSYVNVIHSSVGLASDQISSGFRIWDSLFHTALYIGRTAGKQPQVPLTNKSLGVDKLIHNLTKKQQEKALDFGVKITIWNSYLLKFVCLQDVNSLQDNERLFTPQGKSHQGSFMRIVEQINKELVVNAEIELLSDENGINVNTLNKGDVKNFTETYLESRLAKVDEDNLLLNYSSVIVQREGDAWKVNYGIVVNNEINKIFFTGFLFS